MRRAVCPNCRTHNNYALDADLIHIVVTSSKLSPLVKEKKLLHSPSVGRRRLRAKGQEMQEVMAYIE
jgi:hypothetical protein